MTVVNRRKFLQLSTMTVPALAMSQWPAVETNCHHQGIGHRNCCGRPDAILIKGHLGTQAMRRALVLTRLIPKGSAGDNISGGPYWPTADRMSRKLGSVGIAATAVSPTTFLSLGAEISAKFKKHQMVRPLTIIGYSAGADAAIDVAHQLKKSGIVVDTLLLIETTLGVRRIPNNVTCCLNLYKPKPMTDWLVVARGTKVRAESKNTRLVNINWGADKNFRFLWENHGHNHLNIADCHVVQDYLTQLAADRIADLRAQSSQDLQYWKRLKTCAEAR